MATHERYKWFKQSILWADWTHSWTDKQFLCRLPAEIDDIGVPIVRNGRCVLTKFERRRVALVIASARKRGLIARGNGGWVRTAAGEASK